MTMSVLRRLVIGLCAFALVGNVAKATDTDDLQNIRALADAKNYQEAMEQLDAYLDRNTGDAQGRFLKGILLSDQKRFDDAIEVFVSLTEDYPELPEPYNNLAVLYASHGKYLKARDALLIAIKTHPSYATAHENLGDIYAMMATEAYKKALALNEGNQSAKTKLAMIRDLFPKQSVSTANIAANEKTSQPIERENMVSAHTESDPPSSTMFSSIQPSQSPPTPLATSASDIEAEVFAILEEWATAWSRKDVNGYLAFYAPTFIPSDGVSFSSWKKQRRRRVLAPKSISIEILEPYVAILGNDRVRVDFTQKYRSNTYRDTVRKVIEMTNIDGDWRFVREETK
uniref:Tetratricopeptide repeat-containing protein n=1 Tax=Candidatus Kentrum sp. FW TaxID=2126338 RepID=A0A450T7P6_9GAMM|nr:MAG: Tetratricopeptide repeat-containing protein [Candidatus Kentron sp. FW]